MQYKSLIFILLFYIGNSALVPIDYQHEYQNRDTSATYQSQPYQQYHQTPDSSHQYDSSGSATLISNENDYETSDSMDGYQQTSYADNSGTSSSSSLPSAPTLSSPSDYVNTEMAYDQRDTMAEYPQDPQEYPDNAYYTSASTDYQSQGSKEDTVGEMYFKKPYVDDYNENYDEQPGYGYKQNNLVTSTEYKTGKYLKLPKKPSITTIKTMTFPVPQTTTGYKQPSNSPLPSLEMTWLNKLVSNDLLKNSPLRIPSIDFNYILGNLFGQKDPAPSISFAAPEGAGTLLTHLVGVGKPVHVNAPDIDILGSTKGKTKTKVQGFSVPDFLKTSANLLNGDVKIPSIDFSGEHESGFTLPHIDLPKTHSKGVSPKITAIPPYPSIHVLKHLPLPSIPKIKMPELGPFKNLKMPKFDFTKIQKKDGLEAAEDNLKPTYITPISNAIGMPKPEFAANPLAKAITITKPKKIVTAYPLQKGPLFGHVVIEDYPFGRQQYGPGDDGGEPEIGCAELDKIIQVEPKPIVTNYLFGLRRPLV